MTTLDKLAFPVEQIWWARGIRILREHGSSHVELDGVAELDQSLILFTLSSEGTGRQEEGVRPGFLPFVEAD